MLKTATSYSSSISWVERKLCDPGIFVSFFKLLYPQYLEIGIFVEWMNRDIKPWKQMRSLRKKVPESTRGLQSSTLSPWGHANIWGLTEEEEETELFPMDPLKPWKSVKGTCFSRTFASVFGSRSLWFSGILCLVASSSPLHEDRTGKDLSTSRPQGWPWGNWGWTGMDRVECMG